MKNSIIILMLVMLTSTTYCQVGINTNNIDPTAILQLDSLGFLMPSMTTLQRDNISAPAGGLMVFNTEDNCIQFYKTSSSTWSECLSDKIEKSCLEHYNKGEITDGLYVIDPDGDGGNDPFECYCNMTTDGGGWTKIFTQEDNSIAYLDRFNPSSSLWNSGFNSAIYWNTNNWASTGDYIIPIEYTEIKYSWIPGDYDGSGLGKVVVKGSSTFLYKADSHSANATGQYIKENGTIICNSCTTNYPSIRSGLYIVGNQTELNVHFTDFENYQYNFAQIKEFWVR